MTFDKHVNILEMYYKRDTTDALIPKRKGPKSLISSRDMLRRQKLILFFRIPIHSACVVQLAVWLDISF